MHGFIRERMKKLLASKNKEIDQFTHKEDKQIAALVWVLEEIIVNLGYLPDGTKIKFKSSKTDVPVVEKKVEEVEEDIDAKHVLGKESEEEHTLKDIFGEKPEIKKVEEEVKDIEEVDVEKVEEKIEEEPKPSNKKKSNKKRPRNKKPSNNMSTFSDPVSNEPETQDMF